MAATCSLFYGSRINFGGDFWLYSPIDKTEVPILYNLKLDKRSLKRPFKFRKSQTERRALVWEKV